MSVPTLVPTRQIELRRHTDAQFLNTVVNHPEVRPWVGSPSTGELDMSRVVEDPHNFVLMAEYGGVVFHFCQPGLYEAHTQVLPEGRGDWTVSMVNMALSRMFTMTSAVEIITRVPEGNIPALKLVKKIHGSEEFTVAAGWCQMGVTVPATLFSLSVQNWIRTAPGLPGRGSYYDKIIRKQVEGMGGRVNRLTDEHYLRTIGATLDMVHCQQPLKAVALYNRWASMAGWGQCRIAVERPLILDFGGLVMMFKGGTFQVVECP